MIDGFVWITITHLSRPRFTQWVQWAYLDGDPFVETPANTYLYANRRTLGFCLNCKLRQQFEVGLTSYWIACHHTINNLPSRFGNQTRVEHLDVVASCSIYIMHAIC